MKCGGTSPAAVADGHVQSVCDKVRPSLEDKVGRKFSEYKALLVAKQVVAGTNYFVKVRPSLEDKVGRKFSEYKALLVAKQVVAGTNYFVKLHIGNDQYIHVRIFHPLPGQGDPEVHSYQLDKTKEDVVEFF